MELDLSNIVGEHEISTNELSSLHFNSYEQPEIPEPESDHEEPLAKKLKQQETQNEEPPSGKPKQMKTLRTRKTNRATYKKKPYDD